MKFFTCAVPTALLLIAAVGQSSAQSTGRMQLGSTENFAKTLRPKAAISTTNSGGSGNTMDVKVAPGTTLALDINVERTEGADGLTFVGSVVGKPNSSFYIHLDGGELVGNIILEGSDEAYRYGSDEQGVAFVERTGIDGVLCVKYEEDPTAASAAIVNGASQISAAALSLQSLPGAATCVLIDVDGQYVSGTGWNKGNPINAAPSGMSDGQVQEMWELVSEDFKAFNVNITTNEGVFNSYPRNKRMRCIVSPTNTAAPGAGGVAYLRSFSWDDDTPCWVFMPSPKAGGEAVSHEIGHTIGLNHDGRTSPSEGYFAGHGNWSPIMGVGYYKPITQWSRGEYNNANNREDDLSIMKGYMPFRNDDHGNAIQGATSVGYGSDGGVALTRGVIDRTNDVDFFKIEVGAGRTTLNINVADRHSDLETSVRLFEGKTGKQIGSFNGGDQNTKVEVDLGAGVYYFAVDGTGVGDPRTNGFSDYGSLGAYRITGRVPVGGGNPNPNPPTPPNPGKEATFYVDCDFRGASIKLPVGKYDLGDLAARGLPNDKLSSLRVPSGYEVLLYWDSGFRGAVASAKGDVGCLDASGWNDKASSIQVRAVGGGGNTVAGAQLEAEEYTAMNGIQTQACSEGGENVGWIDDGDWMSFNEVKFPATGKYLVEYRVASPNGGGGLSLDLNAGSVVLGKLNVPKTGGWQNWQTISHTVDVKAGTYNLGVFADKGEWNLNWLKITPTGSAALDNRTDGEIVELASAQSDAKLTLYPNPVVSELLLNAPAEWQSGQIEIFNTQGAKVLETAYTETLNVENLATGVYSLVLTNEDQRLVKRFVKR